MVFGFLLSAPGAMGGALLLAPLWAVVGVLAAPWRSLRSIARNSGLALVLFLAFFLWAQVSMLWAPHYDLTVSSHMAGGVLTGLLLLAAFMHDPGARDARLMRTAAIAFAFGTLALGFIEIFGKAPIARLVQPEMRVDLIMRGPMKGVTVLVATLWGVAGIMWSRGKMGRYAAGALALGATILAFNSDMDANGVAIMFGAAGFAAGLVFQHHAFRVVAFALAAFVLLTPAIFSAVLPILDQFEMRASWDMRVMIWRETLDHIMQNPLFGSGFGSFREVALSFDFEGTKITAQHTHNAALQIWFETGLVGAALVSAALAALAWTSADALRGEKAASAAAVGTICALTPIAFLSWAIWQEWWVATLFLAGGLAGAVYAANGHETAPSRTELSAPVAD